MTTGVAGWLTNSYGWQIRPSKSWQEPLSEACRGLIHVSFLEDDSKFVEPWCCCSHRLSKQLIDQLCGNKGAGAITRLVNKLMVEGIELVLSKFFLFFLAYVGHYHQSRPNNQERPIHNHSCLDTSTQQSRANSWRFLTNKVIVNLSLWKHRWQLLVAKDSSSYLWLVAV